MRSSEKGSREREKPVSLSLFGSPSFVNLIQIQGDRRMKAVETRFSLFICNGKEAVIEKKENGIYLKGRKKKRNIDYYSIEQTRGGATRRAPV